MAVTRKEAYSALVGLVVHAEQISWNRLYNFLTGNSILVLAWATVYVAKLEPADSMEAKSVMVAICAVGFVMSVLFVFLGRRGRLFLKNYLRWGRRMEEEPDWLAQPMTWSHFIRDKVELPKDAQAPPPGAVTTRGLPQLLNSLSGSDFLLQAIPGAFVLLYGLLFCVSIGRHYL